MQITAYLKPTCGYSRSVRETLLRYNLPYEDKNIHIPEIYAEMVQKSGQPLSPCVEIDGEMLADIDGDELEEHLLRADNDVCARQGQGL